MGASFTQGSQGVLEYLNAKDMALEGNAGLGAKYMGDMDEGTRR